MTVEEPSTVRLMLEAGDVDVAEISPKFIAQLQNRPGQAPHDACMSSRSQILASSRWLKALWSYVAWENRKILKSLNVFFRNEKDFSDSQKRAWFQWL